MDAFPMSDSNVARVIHQSQKLIHPTPASSARLPLDSMGSLPAPQAPSVPDGVHAKGKQRALQIGAQIRAHMTDPTMNTADALMEKADAFLKEVSSTQSPITQRNRVKSLSDWAGYLAVAKPLVPTEQHWDRNIVEENWKGFLFTMVHVYKPRDPRKPLKASTLVWWSGLFLHSIVTYTRDPVSGSRCGMTLLIQHGVYDALKAQILKCKFSALYLATFAERLHPQWYMITSSTATKRSRCRKPVLQNIIRFLLPFFFGSRASSLGPTDKKWRDLNYASVPVLSDIRCLRLGYMDYQFPFRMRYSKNAIGTAVGDEQTFLITGCLFAHNVAFDLTVPLLAHLFHLRRFEKKYKAKLVEDDSAELKIDPVFKDTPIFLAGNEGGRDFASPETAAMAESAYEAFGEWCQKAGLPKVGFRALRCDTGNMFSLQMGTRVAKDALHHQTDGPFRDSYSRDTQNFDFVPLRLGEVAGTKESAPGEKIAENYRRHGFRSPAVECLVRQAREAPDSEQAAKYARESFKKNLVNSDPLQPLSAARNGAWAAYLGCFNASAACYKMGTEGCNRIYNIASGIIDGPASEKKPVAFSHPWNKDTTIPARDHFLAAQSAFLKEQTHQMRLYDSAKKQERTKEIKTGALAGNTDERQAVMAALAAPDPGKHLRQALALAAAPADTNDLTSIRSWADNIQNAQTALATIEAGETPDADSQNEHDKLISFLDNMSLSTPTPEMASVAAQRRAHENQPATAEDEDVPDAPPDLNESAERDILQIPVAEARRALLEYYLEPIFRRERFEAYRVIPFSSALHRTHGQQATAAEIAAGAKAGYKCPRCSLYLHQNPVPSATFDAISQLERHLLSMHSEWADLELQIVDVGPGNVSYKCPAGDFRQGFTFFYGCATDWRTSGESVNAVREHALAQCIHAPTFLQMVKAHKENGPRHEVEAYKDSRKHRSHLTHGTNRIAESDGEDEGGGNGHQPAPGKGPKAQLEDLIAASAELSLADPDDTAVIVGVLKDYLKDVDELPVLKKGAKSPGTAQWDALGLDKL
ncbi:hypothetical protein B0H13DRAFT_2480063 [Mycena leptocephala]|nr:hypothetical protein B0H13DRAFT_2480063 [Mycena leptocephala]